MSKYGFLRGLAPARLISAVRVRGLRGVLHHSLRRAGTLMERPLVGPSLLRINPMGYVCNHKCPMCWLQHLDPDELKRQKVTDREAGLRLADYVRLFESMPPGLAEVNVVGGGEPLVHPEAAEIMAEVKRKGWRGSLITNGTLLKEETSRRLVEIGWDEVRVSVHAGDPETYRLIQGVDRYDTMKSNLRTYDRIRRDAGRAARCRLHIFHVLQRENLGSVAGLFKIAEEVGADFLEFDKVIPHDPSMALSASELTRLQESLAECARSSPVPCNIMQILPELKVEEYCAAEQKPFVPAKRCSVGFDQTFVTSLGEVLPCCFSSEVMGNVREKPFYEIWAGEKYQKFRVRLINGKFARYCIDSRCTMPGVLHD